MGFRQWDPDDPDDPGDPEGEDVPDRVRRPAVRHPLRQPCAAARLRPGHCPARRLTCVGLLPSDPLPGGRWSERRCRGLCRTGPRSPAGEEAGVRVSGCRTDPGGSPSCGRACPMTPGGGEASRGRGPLRKPTPHGRPPTCTRLTRLLLPKRPFFAAVLRGRHVPLLSGAPAAPLHCWSPRGRELRSGCPAPRNTARWVHGPCRRRAGGGHCARARGGCGPGPGCSHQLSHPRHGGGFSGPTALEAGPMRREGGGARALTRPLLVLDRWPRGIVAPEPHVPLSRQRLRPHAWPGMLAVPHGVHGGGTS